MRLLRRKGKKDDASDQASGPEVDGNGAVSAQALEADGADPETASPEPTSIEASTLDRDDLDEGHREEGQLDEGHLDEADQDMDTAAPADSAVAEAAPVSPPPGSGPAAGPPPDGDGEARLPVSFYVEGLFKNERPPSRDQLERQAEADFRAAIAPALSPLRELVPDASSPEEAMQALAERQGEYVPDPEGPNPPNDDQFRRGPADTAVYYRIRRHFEKPSRRVGFSRASWTPPPGLAKPELGSGAQRGRRS